MSYGGRKKEIRLLLKVIVRDKKWNNLSETINESKLNKIQICKNSLVTRID